MGDHRLRDPVRGRAPARRATGRPVRPPPALRHRPRALHRQLTARRPRLVGDVADRVPRVAGARRRAALSGGAVDADHDIRGRSGAQHRARHLGCRLGKRRCSRRAARRRADQRVQLVVDLLHQRPRGHHRSRARPVPAAREPGRPLAPHVRRRRCRLDHERPDAARLRDDSRGSARLGHRSRRSVCSRSRLRLSSRSSSSSCARRRRFCRCGSSASEP